MVDGPEDLEDLEDQTYLEMVSWALRSSIDGRRRALRDGLRRAHAAGYARAERDVVAEVRRLLAEAEAALAAPGSWVPEYADAALREVIERITSGACRGAAKEGT